MEAKSNSSRNGVCEECKKKASRYKCPGCGLRSCSLTCVNAHKHRTCCNGRRNFTCFVPLSRFDNNLLFSDFNLLEETKRLAESARRIKSKLLRPPHSKLPNILQTVRSIAASRRTKLLFLPTGMSTRETNQTRFHPKNKYISWTIEWRFHSTYVVLLYHGVHEDTSLCSGLKSPFQELDIKALIRQQLVDTVILEYPVIHVFLPSEHYDFEVIRENHHVTHSAEGKDSSSADNEIPKDVTFNEEEIEKNDSSLDPQVFDLMKHVISSSMHQIPHQNKSEKAFGNSVWSSSTRAGAGNRVNFSSQTKDFEDMEFDFDQGLIDAYSDLITENNPDDFLDLKCEFIKQSETEYGKDLSNSMGVFFAEELKEWDIVINLLLLIFPRKLRGTWLEEESYKNLH
ncbi:hypothetical protein REPUB_Repub12eG0218900 [Reevesia pubescens]